MKTGYAIFLITLLSILSGCYGTITGAVIDSETGEPIEGAVVLVEWTVTKGLGLTYTESYKVLEVVTDKDGKVTISGVFNPLANPPHVTVYKKGYVAWNNEFIFPDYKRRTDFKWENNYIFKLEKFKSVYTHYKHIDFIHTGIHGNGKFRQAIEWEEKKASEEWEAESYVKISGKVVDAKTGEPIEDAIVLVEDWTRRKGWGPASKSDIVFETITDKEGGVTISGSFQLLSRPPGITIYKKGYIAWNNKLIFPSYKIREDFKWQNAYVFKLERFELTHYTHAQHIQFIKDVTYNAAFISEKFKSALKWEEDKSIEEKQ